MRRYFTILLSVSLWSFVLAGGFGDDEIISRILEYCQRVPLEKIFVHTDKPYYAEGDTIWYRVHLLDGATNVPVNRSRFVFVEMYDQTADTLMERQMVKCNSDGVFANALLLPKKLHSGQYTIVAYTQWMRNFGAENFFYKPLNIIGEPLEKAEKPVSTVSATKEADAPKALKDWAVLRGEHLYIRPHLPNGADVVCLVSGNGNLLAFEPKKDKVHRLKTHSLKSGLTNVALVDRNTLKILDESLLSINGGNRAKVSVDGQAKSKKEEMNLDINITDEEGNPLKGSFSLSVADYEVVKSDTLSACLYESIMNTPSFVSLEKMLSQQYPKTEYGFQQEQTITGCVRGTLRKRIKQPRLVMVNPAQGWRQEFELGDSSRFSLAVDLPEHSTILLEATRRSGKTNFVQLEVDSLTFPKVQLPPVFTDKSDKAIPSEFLSQTVSQQKYSMAGVIELPEVVKIGHNKQQITMNWSGMEPIHTYLDHPIFERAATMRQLFQFLNIKGIGKYYVDNFPIGVGEVEDEVFTMIPSQIKSIEYFPKNNPANTLFGVRTPNGIIPGVLFIFTKDPTETNRFIEKYRLSKAVVQQLGYSAPIEFHSPQYPNSDKSQYTHPDYRTTLYWNPDVRTNGSGYAKVKFYASDVSKRYLINIEGVSDDGHIVSKQAVIE